MLAAMKKTSTHYRRGRRLLGRIHGERGLAAIDGLADLAPDLARWVYEFPFGQIYSRPGLQLKSRQLGTVAALVAVGNARPQLKAHLRGALRVGWTQRELLELIMQLAIYVGFPTALNALVVFREVIQEKESDTRKHAVRRRIKAKA